MTQSKPSAGYENWLVVFPQADRDDYFIVMEKHADGTVTHWQYAMFGAVGHAGTLKPEVKTKPVTRAKERAEVDRVKKMIEDRREVFMPSGRTAGQLPEL